MKIAQSNYLIPISSTLITLLANHTAQSLKVDKEITGITVNFTSPSYSADKGGFHPVEIRLEQRENQLWHISYITDFCYVGNGQDTELVKDIDFDIALGICQHQLLGVFPIEASVELFELWQSNFISYVEMEVFKIEVKED